MPDSESGEHKMKIGGIMLSEETGTKKGIYNDAAVEYVHDISMRSKAGGRVFEITDHA